MEGNDVFGTASRSLEQAEPIGTVGRKQNERLQRSLLRSFCFQRALRFRLILFVVQAVSHRHQQIRLQRRQMDIIDLGQRMLRDEFG